jgi:hypothetical protein
MEYFLAVLFKKKARIKPIGKETTKTLGKTAHK